MAAVIKVLLRRGNAGRQDKLPNEAFGSLRLRVIADRDRDLGHSICRSPRPPGRLVIRVDVLNIYIFACM
jgi:hypothetical protein